MQCGTTDTHFTDPGWLALQVGSVPHVQGNLYASRNHISGVRGNLDVSAGGPQAFGRFAKS